MQRQNQVVFACGARGTGKSHWLRTQFVVRAPRVIHLDAVGDYLHDPNVLIVSRYADLLKALRAFAAQGRTVWRVAVPLEDPDEIRALFALLCPQEDFGRRSLSRALGGVALESGECDIIAPNGRTDPLIQGGWRRGRHYHLDLLMATQRPAACDRLLSSQADVTAVFWLDEPRDLDWCRGKFGRRAAERAATLPQHWHLERRRDERQVRVVDSTGRLRESIELTA